MYELLYIVPAIHTEEELKKVIEKVEALLSEEGARILGSKNFGKLKFAYPIKKETAGHYVLVDFDAEDKELLKKFNRALQLERNIIRFMITKKVLKAKEEKEVKITEFKETDITEKKPEKKKESSRAGKEKIKLEDIEKKLDTLLEKEIV